MSDHNLVEIAIVIVCALAGGIFLSRLKHPPILGYILAGVLLGPSCFGLVSDRDAVGTLAELGVLLLLFSIGLELSLRSFRLIWPLAAAAMVLQLLGSLGIIWLFHLVLGWSIAFSFLLACVFALSSTAVAVKMLDGINELRTTTGKIVVAILIAQDLALIPMILIIRSWSHFNTVFWLKICFAIGIFAFVIYLLNRKHRLRLRILDRIVPEHGELLPLASLTLCFASAALAGIAGLSAAYGAFLMGLILSNTHKRKVILEATQPIQSILLMVFFLSVGLLLDLQFVYRNLLTLLSLLVALTVLKTVLNIGVLHLLRQPWSRSFLASIVLAHLGEFSFVLASVGTDSGILDADGNKLIIAVTVLSLLLSPFWLHTGRRLHALSVDHLPNLAGVFDTVYGETWSKIKATFIWCFHLFKSNRDK